MHSLECTPFSADIVTGAHQHVEVDGRLRHNGIVFGERKVVNPGRSWELTQGDLGNLLSVIFLTALPDNLVAITFNQTTHFRIKTLSQACSCQRAVDHAAPPKSWQ